MPKSSLDIQLDRAIATRIAVAQELRLRSDGEGAFSVSYTFGTKAVPIDFGASGSDVIAPPASRRGVIKSIDVYDVTEQFNQTAAGAVVLVGVSGDTDAYATGASLTTLATAAGRNCIITAGVTAITPVDTDILVSFIQSDHGSPAGKGVVTVTFNFFV